MKVMKPNIFAKVLYKTKFSKKKSNQVLLGIDLLKDNVKNDLLCITTLKVEELFNKLLQQAQSPTFNFSSEKGKKLFLLLIKQTCETFLKQQYGYKVNVNLNALRYSLYTKKLLTDTEILFQVPFFVLLNKKFPLFRLIYYPVYNQASEDFIEALIDNLILEISNCVIYYSIINFSQIYAFRQTLYKSKFLSLRNFERFKNNIIWQLRINNYIKRPLDLYNNRYAIFILRTSGIYNKTIYANRSREIASLKRIPLLTIIFVETQDFLTGRLDEAFYLISKSVRFTFTSVFGQIIGLVWRGIIEGLKK